MKFQQVAAPAIRLARDGYPTSPVIAREISFMAESLRQDPGLAAMLFAPDGAPHKAGDTLRSPELAATLASLGDDPVASFYHGDIAQQIAAFVQQKGGILTADDLAQYQPVWREPLHRHFEGYDVYVMPPPSSGGVVLEMLAMLEPGNLGGLGVDSAPYLARLIEVMRQGFVDRDAYGDPAFVKVPTALLLSDNHIFAARARALSHSAPSPTPAPARDHGTTDLLVADAAGNVVALTTTINTPFGAKLTVPKLGILLNDEMDDFAVAPGVPNAFHLAGASANEIAPGKRPLSSMTPTIVLKNGKPVLATGGSGGPTIISGVLQVTLNLLVSHMPPAEAVAEPRVHEQAEPATVAIEDGVPKQVEDELTKMGYALRPVPQLGAVGAILLAPGNLRGDFDHRKGGGAEGY
ncbi:MAG TPA: gamma-glutamyltransferase, partial [Candidatus Binataceae bacterium]|nr:gamma-glutamyltransferase [Candidatus Binataceae bacterium]